MAITAKELAQRLGLSQSAVSIALNGKPGVSEETRAAVLAAAEQLGYTKSRSKITPLYPQKTICYLIFVDNDAVNVVDHTTFSTFVFQGLDACAASLGYKTLVRYCYSDSILLPQMTDLLQHVDGIIFLGTNLSEKHTADIDKFLLETKGLPVIVVDSFALSDRLNSIGNDGFAGGRLVAEHLLSLGHRRIGYLRFRQRLSNFQAREDGLRAGLQAQGLSPAPIVDVDISSDGAFQDFDAWLSLGRELPDAFFAENDVVAVAALRALKKHGIQVPSQVSLIGFDDLPICELVDPPLTTVHAHKEQLGVLAMSQLHQLISQGDWKRYTGIPRTLVSMSLVERGSTAKK